MGSTQRTASPGLGSIGSGAITAGALAVQQGLAAVVGVVIAREFGRGAETDGFFASYGVFVVLALAATASRVVLLPALARARDQRRLGRETASYAVARGVLALALLVAVTVGRNAFASLLTGFDEGVARTTAAATLPWLVAAAVGQLFAGLAASALAALDDYRAAALGYTLGSVLGLALILWRVDADGLDAVAWGMALNAAIAVAVPGVALVVRARRAAMPAGAVRPDSGGGGHRLGALAAGVTLPLVLQATYLVLLPFAAGEGVGSVTSLGYAYLAGSAVISVTASALALVTAVPLTRTGLDAHRVAFHVASSSGVAFVALAAVVGVAAVAGEPVADAVLGGAYGDDVGQELGRFVLALSPWMAVTVGVSVTFPLVFVAGAGSRLPFVALMVLAVHVPLAWLGDAVAGVYGLALALALSATVGLVGLLRLLHAAAATLRGLAVAAAAPAVAAALAFGSASLVLGVVPAAAVGTALYAGILLLLRPRGLRDGWRYLRSLA